MDVAVLVLTGSADASQKKTYDELRRPNPYCTPLTHACPSNDLAFSCEAVATLMCSSVPRAAGGAQRVQPPPPAAIWRAAASVA